MKKQQRQGQKKIKSSYHFPKILSSNETDPWKHALFERLDRIREVCGELCNISNAEEHAEKAIRDEEGRTSFEAKVDCDRIMSSDDIDEGDASVPAKIPDELMKFYTLDGAIPINYRRLWNNVYLGGDAYSNVWTEEEINANMKLAANDSLRGSYDIVATSKLKNRLKSDLNLKGKSILVIGSERPWVESICLLLGAANVTTLEYGQIISKHPQITTFTPDEFREKYKEKTLDLFDGVVTYSSIEHSGLGRYGDALNPWGDILAAARAWCVTKPGGFFVLDLPGGRTDAIKFNANRIYGPLRWPLVTTNWKLHPLDSGDFTEGGPHVTHFFVKIDY